MDNQEIIMIRVIIRIDQIVDQNRYRLNSGDRRTSFSGRGQYRKNYREDHNMSILIEMTLGETILEKCIIIEVKILEVEIEVIIEMTTLEEVEVDLGKDNIQVILAEMIKVVVVDQDQVQELVLTETKLDVLSTGNMIISLKAVQIHKQKKGQNKYIMYKYKIYNLDEEQTTLAVLATDMYDNLIRTNSHDAVVEHLNL